ncbi:MAG: DUF438 domain-containing protein [Caldicoprobacterales bacterium]|jgi:DUF438 domain-containing protein|nr:DUF438 domain-containing protein [Clostridiales bacterium]
MSEIINNREERQRILKELIKELHDGKTVDDVKERFDQLIKGVSVSEISQMEQNLIAEGLPVEEVQRLCDVHAAVFKGSIEDIHKPQAAHEQPGHPVHTFILENRALERLIENSILPALDRFEKNDKQENIEALLAHMKKLLEVDRHFSRKENILFPYLEKYEITGPPKVMWGVDDEIREDIKKSIRLLNNYDGSSKNAAESVRKAVHGVKEMIFKEENILFPLALETLTEDEWRKMEEDSDEIGYTLVRPAGKWKPERRETVTSESERPVIDKGTIRLETGVFTTEELEAMLNSLPVDITFVDKNDTVKYFSQGKERIFDRTKAVIGRSVQNCHPPASVHVVEKIVEDLRSGRKDSEEFWIQRGDLFVHIRYFAVRNEAGDYLGTVEFTQNIRPLQALTGEKRLLDE